MSKNKPTKNFNDGKGFRLARVSGSNGERHCLHDHKTGATTGSILSAWEDLNLGYMVETSRSIYIAGHPQDLQSGIKLLSRYGANRGAVSWDDDTPSPTPVKEEPSGIGYGIAVDFLAVTLEAMTGGILTAKRRRNGSLLCRRLIGNVAYVGGKNTSLTRSAAINIGDLLKGEVNIVFYNLPVRDVCRSLENGVTPAESDVKSVSCDTFKSALKETCRLLRTL